MKKGVVCILKNNYIVYNTFNNNFFQIKFSNIHTIFFPSLLEHQEYRSQNGITFLNNLDL
jgi:hypothetical protein